ncbi:MAG TPA: HD domain-containing phosphohydrolase [Chloroflexaceae bacterium]|nr:HD domain-containing phosphohydrolase [Chloroflexaceae bacterium]
MLFVSSRPMRAPAAPPSLAGRAVAAIARWLRGAAPTAGLSPGGAVAGGEPALCSVVRKLLGRGSVETTVNLQGAALTAAASAIAITSADGVIQWVNPAFTRLTGYPAAEAVGRTMAFLSSGRQDRAFYAALWETILAGRIWRGELVNRRKDGTLYTEEQTITPVRGPGGAISHFVAIKLDITARKAGDMALRAAHEALLQAYDATLAGWSAALDMRDRETEGHSRRVTELTVRLARALGLGGEELEHMRRGATLHDIGKLAIPDAILHKPGPLSEEEWTVMRRHPQLAHDLLAPIGFLRQALDIPLCHHERWDGSGYPRGLAGAAIPLAARIFAVVDVWDALTSDRCYRPAWAPRRARAYLAEQAGRLFDPWVVAGFLAILDQPGAAAD